MKLFCTGCNAEIGTCPECGDPISIEDISMAQMMEALEGWLNRHYPESAFGDGTGFPFGERVRDLNPGVEIVNHFRAAITINKEAMSNAK